MKNTHLVYSSNPELNKTCLKCKEKVSECVCLKSIEVSLNQIIAVLRIEKTGRSGKTVTVIDRLPKTEGFLKDLCTQLKKKCGSGGTIVLTGVDGMIEIQGDKRDLIRVELLKKGIKVKG